MPHNSFRDEWGDAPAEILPETFCSRALNDQARVALTAQLALMQLLAGETDEARKNAQWVLSREPDNPFALSVMYK